MSTESRADAPADKQTIREHFAGLAMQGLLANNGQMNADVENQIALSVEYADALIAELAKPKTPSENGKFLAFIADRLEHQHGENGNVDFILKLRELAKVVP
jgi:hypothetical protein